MSKKLKEKQFLCEFIELYKSFPCLWKVKSKEYSDRNAKSRAYETLVEKMKELDQDADRNSVVKKINCLRTVYRKELRKVIDSERCGAGESVYVPHLWYFDLLSFLHDQEISGESSSSMQYLEVTMDPNEDITDVVSPEISPPTTPNPAFNCSSTTRPVKRKILMCEDALNVTENGLSYTNADRFDLAAKTWAAKLRELDSNQRIHAEKLINDVLYEAELGNLNRHCKIWIQPALHILQPTLPSRAE